MILECFVLPFLLFTLTFISDLLVAKASKVAQRCILSTTNGSCLEINDLCLDKFGLFCEKRTYLSVASAICGAVKALSNEELQSINISIIKDISYRLSLEEAVI